MDIEVKKANDDLEIWYRVRRACIELREAEEQARQRQRYVPASLVIASRKTGEAELGLRGLLREKGILNYTGLLTLTPEARMAGVVDPRHAESRRRYPPDNAPEESAR